MSSSAETAAVGPGAAELAERLLRVRYAFRPHSFEEAQMVDTRGTADAAGNPVVQRAPGGRSDHHSSTVPRVGRQAASPQALHWPVEEPVLRIELLRVAQRYDYYFRVDLAD